MAVCLLIVLVFIYQTDTLQVQKYSGGVNNCTVTYGPIQSAYFTTIKTLFVSPLKNTFLVGTNSGLVMVNNSQVFSHSFTLPFSPFTARSLGDFGTNSYYALTDENPNRLIQFNETTNKILKLPTTSPKTIASDISGKTLLVTNATTIWKSTDGFTWKILVQGLSDIIYLCPDPSSPLFYLLTKSALYAIYLNGTKISLYQPSGWTAKTSWSLNNYCVIKDHLYISNSWSIALWDVTSPSAKYLTSINIPFSWSTPNVGLVFWGHDLLFGYGCAVYGVIDLLVTVNTTNTTITVPTISINSTVTSCPGNPPSSNHKCEKGVWVSNDTLVLTTLDPSSSVLIDSNVLLGNNLTLQEGFYLLVGGNLIINKGYNVDSMGNLIVNGVIFLSGSLQLTPSSTTTTGGTSSLVTTRCIEGNGTVYLKLNPKITYDNQVIIDWDNCSSDVNYEVINSNVYDCQAPRYALERSSSSLSLVREADASCSEGDHFNYLVVYISVPVATVVAILVIVLSIRLHALRQSVLPFRDENPDFMFSG